MAGLDQNLADTIGMLEQILEVMPQDIDALKALYNANFQNANVQRSFDYLSRIVGVASDVMDPELFDYLLNELPKFEQSYASEVAMQQERIEALLGMNAIHEEVSFEPDRIEESQNNQSSEADISEELALAWRLYEENQLSQDEYSTVLHDLTEVSSKELNVPVSVLHVLSDRGFSGITRIMVHASNRSGMPFISLDNFELDEAAVKSLPQDYPLHEGALPFGFMGNNLLVGVLNPFNSTLFDKIERESGHRCHAFLVEPIDYDATLSAVRAIHETAAA